MNFTASSPIKKNRRNFLQTTIVAAALPLALLNLARPAQADEAKHKSEETPMAHSIIQGPQGQLAVVRMGTGKGLPLLFMHADPGRASQGDRVMTALSQDHSVAAYGARGSGNSSSALTETTVTKVAPLILAG